MTDKQLMLLVGAILLMLGGITMLVFAIIDITDSRQTLVDGKPKDITVGQWVFLSVAILILLISLGLFILFFFSMYGKSAIDKIKMKAKMALKRPPKKQTIVAKPVMSKPAVQSYKSTFGKPISSYRRAEPLLQENKPSMSKKSMVDCKDIGYKIATKLYDRGYGSKQDFISDLSRKSKLCNIDQDKLKSDVMEGADALDIDPDMLCTEYGLC